MDFLAFVLKDRINEWPFELMVGTIHWDFLPTILGRPCQKNSDNLTRLASSILLVYVIWKGRNATNYLNRICIPF